MATQSLYMGVQVYAYAGFLNLRQMLYQRKLIVKDVLSEFFTDATTAWSNTWNGELKPILFTFGNTAFTNIATPDKPTTQGDGSVTPWKITRSVGIMNAAYKQLVAASVTINSNTPLEITADMPMDDPKEAAIRRARWETIFDLTEKIYEIESTAAMYLMSIRANQYAAVTTSIQRSPGQLLTVGGMLSVQAMLQGMGGGTSVAQIDRDFLWSDMQSGIYIMPFGDLLEWDATLPDVTVEVLSDSNVALASGGTYIKSLSSITGTIVTIPNIVVLDHYDNGFKCASPDNYFWDSTEVSISQSSLTSKWAVNGTDFPTDFDIKIYVTVEN